MCFARFALSLCLLFTLASCGELDKVFGNPQDRAKYEGSDPNAKPFEIGPASKWQEPGLYMDFAKSNDVALKSGNGMLVAILLISPDTGERVQYDRLSNLFRDPQTGKTFTTDGLKWGGSNDRLSLPRCRMRHLGQLDDPDVQLLVDPGKLYRQTEGGWSKAASNHLFLKP